MYDAKYYADKINKEVQSHAEKQDALIVNMANLMQSYFKDKASIIERIQEINKIIEENKKEVKEVEEPKEEVKEEVK